MGLSTPPPDERRGPAIAIGQLAHARSAKWHAAEPPPPSKGQISTPSRPSRKRLRSRPPV